MFCTEAVLPSQTYCPGTGWPCSQQAGHAVTLCDFTSFAQPGDRPGLGWTQCSGLAEMLSAHSVAAVSPGTCKGNPSCSQAIGYCLELHLHTAQSRGWAHLQIHSNPAKSCSTHCFEICTVLQGVKDLLRVSLHLLTYRTEDLMHL